MESSLVKKEPEGSQGFEGSDSGSRDILENLDQIPELMVTLVSAGGPVKVPLEGLTTQRHDSLASMKEEGTVSEVRRGWRRLSLYQA